MSKGLKRLAYLDKEKLDKPAHAKATQLILGENPSQIMAVLLCWSDAFEKIQEYPHSMNKGIITLAMDP